MDGGFPAAAEAAQGHGFGIGNEELLAEWDSTGKSLTSTSVLYDGTTFAVSNAGQVCFGENNAIPANWNGIYLATGTGAYPPQAEFGTILRIET